jgi:hypothetical protein
LSFRPATVRIVKAGPRAMRAPVWWAWIVLAFMLALAFVPAAHAEGAELTQLTVDRDAENLALDFAVKVSLSRPVEEALQRGVPLYFVADAKVYRWRWYWRDERVARVTKTWRLSYQPLTSTWRVSQGGLHQSYPTLDEALSAVSRSAHWKIAETGQIDPDERHYIEFSWRLDTSQLPRPMQIGIGGQADWQISVERTLRLDRS